MRWGRSWGKSPPMMSWAGSSRASASANDSPALLLFTFAAIFAMLFRRHNWEAIMRRFSCLLIAITVIASPAFAQPLADKVPANPVFYFGWRGSDDLGPAYAESHMKAVIDQSNIPAVFSDMVPRAVMRIGRENLEAGMALRTATTV